MIFNIETNKIVQRDEISEETLKNSIPEGAIYFEGIVSDGNKNRNGYIIESKAWFFDENSFVNDFLKTGSVLYNHDDSKPIGRPLSMEKASGGKIKVSGYVYDDTYTNGAIGRGLILGLSTGHITHERMWENTKGERVTDDEFWELPWNQIFSNEWTMVVTKAEIVEFSFVTTRSNRASVLVNAYSEKFRKDPNEVETLFAKHRNSMKDVNNTTSEVPEDVGTQTPEAEATPEVAPATDEAGSTGGGVDTNSVKTDEVDTLKNKVLELEQNLSLKDGEVESLKAEKNALQEKLSNLEETQRNALLNGGEVPNKKAEDEAEVVKDHVDLKKKYIKS